MAEELGKANKQHDLLSCCWRRPGGDSCYLCILDMDTRAGKVESKEQSLLFEERTFLELAEKLILAPVG